MDIKDIIVKCAKANSAQELKELAAKENMPLTDEQAEEYFAELQEYLKKQQTGELSDDELDDVNGGKCRISCPNVDPGGWCTEGWVCAKCKGTKKTEVWASDRAQMVGWICSKCRVRVQCCNCKYFKRAIVNYVCTR